MSSDGCIFEWMDSLSLAFNDLNHMKLNYFEINQSARIRFRKTILHQFFSANREQILLGPFRLVPTRLLGEGSFGQVFLGYHTQLQYPVAIKVVREFDREWLQREISALSKAQSRFVVKLLHFQVLDSTAFIITEFCESNLSQVLGRVDRRKAVSLSRQLAQALLKLAQMNLIHRDLKLENVLLKNGQVRLADFGFCRQLQQNCSLLRSQRCGTPATMPPQVLYNLRPIYDLKCDVWSFGIIVFQLMYKHHPSISTQQDCGNFYQQQGTIPQLIRNCLAINPADRPSMAVCHKILKQQEQRLKDMLIMALLFCLLLFILSRK